MVTLSIRHICISFTKRHCGDDFRRREKRHIIVDRQLVVAWRYDICTLTTMFVYAFTQHDIPFSHFAARYVVERSLFFASSQHHHLNHLLHFAYKRRRHLLLFSDDDFQNFNIYMFFSTSPATCSQQPNLKQPAYWHATAWQQHCV